MSKKLIFISLLSAIFLSGCASFYDSLGGTSGYYSPGLKQLKGRHISLVIDRIQYFPHVDIGMFSNKYYLYKECDHVSDTVTYNQYGTILNRKPNYNCGSIYFVTDKDGIITNYIEEGWRYTEDRYQHLFKDVIVIGR